MKKRLFKILILFLVFLLGLAAGYLYFQKIHPQKIETQKQETNVYIKFLSEVYDKIKENYWNKLDDEDLGNLFKLGIEKLSGKTQDIKIKDKQDFEDMLTDIFKIVKEDKNKDFTVQLSQLVLMNLEPQKRNALYTAKNKEDLGNRVQNINPENDLYKILGLDKNASQQQIEDAYENKASELEPKKDKSEEAKQELEKVNYAYQTLNSPDAKEIYDKKGIEPTVFGKLVRPDMLHLYIKKMSPTTLDELEQTTEKFDNTTGLDTLILDLRDNIGGSIELLTYLLGPFIGPDRYAFDFFHQGDKTPYKTKIGWLPSLARYKKVVILINENTQSSAEIMAATLKKYNVGVLVGNKTKGWGTIESVIDVNTQIDPQEKYSIFLVNSLSLNEDNQPIEGKGVSPTIQINDSGWENQLFAYFHYPELAKAVKEIWNTPPSF